MIQLRPNCPTVARHSSNFPLAGAGGQAGAYAQMRHEVACYNATAQAGEWIENWFANLPGRIASYVYSKLPTFSLPAASASEPCNGTPVCTIPEGSYKERCNPPKVTYLNEEDECELTARCETMFEGLPLQQTSIRFAPGATITVENRNGTLVTISDQDNVEWAFQRIAKATKGRVIRSPLPEKLPKAVEEAAEQILKDSGTSESLDLAFVLDTTGSMGPYIEQIKLNLLKFLEQLQNKKDTRVAIVEYRDKGEAFLTRINTRFTNDFREAGNAVQSLKTSGGGDEPEAVLDALLSAKNELVWNPKAKHAVLLIGDQPGHPRTIDGRHDESEVVAQYVAAETRIAVYPVIAEHGPKPATP